VIGLLWVIAAAAAQPIVATPVPFALRAGTPVPLVTATEVNSKTHRQGARFDLTVSEDVRVGDLVVIPKGAGVPTIG
jgi:type IV secretory pathway VirB10-like protein